MDNSNNNETHEEFMQRMREGYEKGLDRIRESLRALGEAELLEAIRGVDDEYLNWICETIAIPTEDYEICTAVHIILEERGLK